MKSWETTWLQIALKHEFTAGQKAMWRIGSDVYAVTIESVTATTATVGRA